LIYSGRKLILSGIALILLLFASIGSGAHIASAEQGADCSPGITTRIVALGDSVTVGNEPGKTDSKVLYGYVDRIFEQALYHGRAEVHNYGITDLTSAGLKNFVQAIVAGDEITKDVMEPKSTDPRFDTAFFDSARIKADIACATVIAIMVGGNEYKSFILQNLNKTENEMLVLAEEAINQYMSNVRAAVDTIIQLNPSTRIVIADQYMPVPSFYGQQLYAKLTKVREGITQALEDYSAALDTEKYNVAIARAGEKFIKNEATHTYALQLDIHPNQKGYQLIAQAFAEQIWGTYQTPKYKDPIALIVGGKELETVYKPILINYSTFVPIREYTEALGAKVGWDQATKMATISMGEKIVKLTLDSDTITVGEQQVKISDKVRMHNNKIYIPLRAMAEGLGFDVKFIGKSNTAYINLK
jgi:lysophospholipase L1-like esterase